MSEEAPINEAPTKLTMKQVFIVAYAAVAILFTLWNWLFGAENYRGFFYNMGKSLVWPFQLFPVFGQIVGGIVAVVFVVLVLVLGSDRKDS